jgi:predicted transcriptional regulator
MPQPHIAAKIVSVKLDAITRDRIANLAEVRHRSSHWIMREAISQYIEREEKREVFRQVTIEAMEEHQQTGLYASAVDVEAWLASWGTEGELSAPICHL